jgi:hypothetical protein
MDSKTGVQDPSHGKKFQNECFWILSHCQCGLLVWHLRASRSSTSRQDLEQNQMSPLSPQERYPRILRVVIHHNKDVPLPTRRSHTSWANKVHMEQLTWTLSHHIGERRVRRGYQLGMPTRCTNQLFLKPQPWHSSDQIEFTLARQKVKAQVTNFLCHFHNSLEELAKKQRSTPEDCEKPARNT